MKRASFFLVEFSTDWSQAAPQDIESNAKVEWLLGSPVVKNQPAGAGDTWISTLVRKDLMLQNNQVHAPQQLARALSLGTTTTERWLQPAEACVPWAHRSEKSHSPGRKMSPPPQLRKDLTAVKTQQSQK